MRVSSRERGGGDTGHRAQRAWGLFPAHHPPQPAPSYLPSPFSYHSSRNLGSSHTFSSPFAPYGSLPGMVLATSASQEPLGFRGCLQAPFPAPTPELLTGSVNKDYLPNAIEAPWGEVGVEG